jgi:hypothetical protein
VSLKFHPLAAKTYDVLQAGIAVNAVDSQRRDQVDLCLFALVLSLIGIKSFQDYLFHPMVIQCIHLLTYVADSPLTGAGSSKANTGELDTVNTPLLILYIESYDFQDNVLENRPYHF